MGLSPLEFAGGERRSSRESQRKTLQIKRRTSTSSDDASLLTAHCSLLAAREEEFTGIPAHVSAK
jgi:hypothetical protein